MKKVKQLNVVPTSLQRFLQDYPPTSRHISDEHKQIRRNKRIIEDQSQGNQASRPCHLQNRLTIFLTSTIFLDYHPNRLDHITRSIQLITRKQHKAFNISEQSLAHFERFLALPDNLLTSLVNGLEKAAIGSLPKSLSTQLYQSLNLDRKNLENILSAIFNLYKAKQQAKKFGIGLEEFVEEVIAFLERRHDEKVNDKTKNHLIQVLSIKSILLTMTAIAIRTEADKLAVETGILTDIRPIFYENDIKGSLILHNLKVEFLENGESKENFFLLDREDLAKLKNQILKAELKEQSIRKKLGSSEIIEIEE